MKRYEKEEILCQSQRRGEKIGRAAERNAGDQGEVSVRGDRSEVRAPSETGLEESHPIGYCKTAATHSNTEAVRGNHGCHCPTLSICGKWNHPPSSYRYLVSNQQCLYLLHREREIT